MMPANAANDDTGFANFAFGKFAAIFLFLTMIAGIVLIVPTLKAASLPDDATGTMLAVFGPGKTDAEIFAAIHNQGGMPVRKTSYGNIWVVHADQPGFVRAIGAYGAVGVYRDLPIGIALAGCAGVIAQMGYSN